MRVIVGLIVFALVGTTVAGYAAPTQKGKGKSSKPAAKKTTKKADPTAAVRNAITGNYRKINAALAKGDIDGALAYYHVDYVGTTNGQGEQDIDDVREGLKRILRDIEVSSLNTTFSNLQLVGDTATVRTSTRLTGLFTDQQRGVLRRIEIRATDQDTWTRTSKGWRLIESNSLTQRTFIDGQEVGGEISQ